MTFNALFPKSKPVIGCIHLLSLPGSPGYEGSMAKVFETALSEAEIFKLNGINGIIIENFRDNPFYPGALPPETIAALSAVTRELVNTFEGPVGVNALRNDAATAMSVAVAAGANFIRVNVHTGAYVADQGIIEGMAYKTLRLRKNLMSDVMIFSDIRVKHASPLSERSLQEETIETTHRGLADALIVTGKSTGDETPVDVVHDVKQNTHLPVLIGSGTTTENVHKLHLLADGFIIGSHFKKDGLAENLVEADRVKIFMERYRLL